MKTKTSLIAGLIMTLLMGTAWSLPGPDNSKNLQDEVNKAYAADKAAKEKAAAASPSREPGRHGKAVNQDSKATERPPLETNFTSHYQNQASSPNGSKEKPTSNLPYTFYDHYTTSPSAPSANKTYDGSPVVSHKPKPMSDTGDWHKKNKKKHHGDDQNQGSFNNNGYDGSPVVYHKPKPMSDTEDWHQKNKNGHHHHADDGRGDNATPQGKGWLYLNLPQDGTAKKKHHHDDD